MTARRLIVTADDFGLTPGVCEGILRAHDRGIVTSTSALAVGPALSSWSAALRDSGLDIGVHLCMVGEDPPVLSRREIPTLVDDRGRLPASWRSAVLRSATRRIDPDDVRREFEAQVEVLTSHGLRPSHLDSHQHVHLWPAIGDVVLGIAARSGARAVRVAESLERTVRGRAVRSLAGRLRRTARAAGVATPDRFAGLDGSGALGPDRMVATLRGLLDSDALTMELGTHPGLAHDPDRSRYDWGFRWADELEALCSARARATVDAADVELIGFDRLRPVSS